MISEIFRSSTNDTKQQLKSCILQLASFSRLALTNTTCRRLLVYSHSTDKRNVLVFSLRLAQSASMVLFHAVAMRWALSTTPNVTHLAANAVARQANQAII